MSRPAAMLALALVYGAPAAARELPAARAPAAWVAYAQAATRTIAARLADPALTPPELGTALAGLEVRLVLVWTAADGRIIRVVAPGLDAAAGRQLQTALADLILSPPPRRMRQPMRLALTATLVPPADLDPGAPSGD